MTEQPDTPPPTMSVADAADRLGQTEHWYLTQLRAGRLPGHKIGRRWRITDDDYREALAITARRAWNAPVDPAGLTPRSRTHHTRRSA